MNAFFRQSIGFENFKSKKSFALLIDPEKFNASESFINSINENAPDFIFIGGSQSFSNNLLTDTIDFLKSKTEIPIIIFPGSSSQIAFNADAIMVLSVIQSTDSEFITGQLIRVATRLKESKLKTIPVAYILIDGGKISSTEKALKNSIQPIQEIHVLENVVNTASIIGIPTIYLEAGSGAKHPVPLEFVQKAKSILKNDFLIVGGGITDVETMRDIWTHGADCIVVGNAIEKTPELLVNMCQARNNMNSFQGT